MEGLAWQQTIENVETCHCSARGWSHHLVIAENVKHGEICQTVCDNRTCMTEMNERHLKCFWGCHLKREIKMHPCVCKHFLEVDQELLLISAWRQVLITDCIETYSFVYDFVVCDRTIWFLKALYTCPCGYLLIFTFNAKSISYKGSKRFKNFL